jgi:hypothetical protein
VAEQFHRAGETLVRDPAALDPQPLLLDDLPVLLDPTPAVVEPQPVERDHSRPAQPTRLHRLGEPRGRIGAGDEHRHPGGHRDGDEQRHPQQRCLPPTIGRAHADIVVGRPRRQATRAEDFFRRSGGRPALPARPGRPTRTDHRPRVRISRR